MTIQSQDDNVFRFVHLRGPRPVRQRERSNSDERLGEAGREDTESSSERSSDDSVRDRLTSGAYANVEDAEADAVSNSDEAEGEEGREGLESSPERRSDAPVWERLTSRAYATVEEPETGEVASELGEGRAKAVVRLPATILQTAVAAKRELESLSPGQAVDVPKDTKSSLTVTSSGLKQLSKATIGLFDDMNISIKDTPVPTLISALDSVIASTQLRRAHSTPAHATSTRPRIEAVGVAELLVVKQQITHYEPGEIAHIENVLDGETKQRTHRRLDRTEEETFSFSEEVATQERELEATERFELNKETSTTAQRDQQKGFGLSLSGKYGPTVEFSSELNIQTNNTQSASSRNAIDYAKDLVERSRDAIVTTTREERRRRTIREIEELNVHTLANESGAHIAGVYQYLDKLYTCQVFNYGLRQMFDFQVPEPASYLSHLNRTPRSEIDLPVPPVELSAFVADASDIDDGNYLELGARYNVAGLEPPPAAWVFRREGVTHGPGDADEDGKPRSFAEAEMEVPQGYVPVVATVSTVLVSDETPTLIVSLGNQTTTLMPTDLTEVNLSQGNLKAYTHTFSVPFLDESAAPLADEAIPLHVFANETANYTVKVKITYWRKYPPLAWKIKTYEKISEAHQNMQLQYQQRVEELNARREQQEAIDFDDFGSPPARNLRIIAAELKKHCLAILRGTHNDALSTAHTGAASPDDPPAFDLAEAMTDGSQIRFLETAFEWDQIQYAFYPYFWARVAEWRDRFNLRNLDPVFEEFLRAGSARVVVPVRPGLEAAVSYFLETGLVWNGVGDPTINDPLYRPIVDEIRERTGASQGELPVGSPWIARIPTLAVKLRKDDALPEWELVQNTAWDWAIKT